MDDYNHMMNPEYGNMVYQPGVVNMPMEGILLQQNNQNNLLQKPDQQQQPLAPQQQSQLQQLQQMQQHPQPQVFIPQQQTQLPQPHQPLQQPPAIAQNNEQHLEQYTTNAGSINPNLPTDQMICSTPTESSTNDRVSSENIQLPSSQVHNEPQLAAPVPSEPPQSELQENQALENHKEVEIPEQQVPLEENVVQSDPNATSSTEQTEAIESVESSEQLNNLSEEPTIAQQEAESGESAEIDQPEIKDEVDAEDKMLEAPIDSTDLIAPVEPKVKQEDEIDEKQCRVCLSKDDLVNLFDYDPKNSLRICDILMKCTTVKITERDYLPHFVCSDCVEKINIAYELKVKCEETDKTLRSKLKRSKKKSRGTTEFLLIDCIDYSSGTDDEQNKEDDDFHLSEVSMASEADSDESFGKKRRSARNRSKRNNNRSKSRSKPKPSAKRKASNRPAPSPVVSSKRSRNSIVYIEAPDESDEDDNVALASRVRTRNRGTTNRSRKPVKQNSSDESDVDVAPRNTRRPGPSSSKKTEYTCNYCAKVFTSQDELRDHKRSHVNEKPSPCPICNKPFKQQSSLTAHMLKHKEDDERRCTDCNQQFASKIELKKHAQTAHTEIFTCEKCKRTFTSKPRLDKHKCPGAATPVKRKNDYDYAMNSGRDLFKSVAPLTTTYWSDSFSD